jgi:hypothetical protein
MPGSAIRRQGRKGAIMRKMLLSAGLCALIAGLAACGGTDTEVTDKLSKKERKTLSAPTQLLVYDFAVSPSEIPADSAVAGEFQGVGDDPYDNAQRTALEHEIADIVADKLVDQLQELKLPARRWHGPAPGGVGVYTIEGQFVTIDKGNPAMRMIVGFGAGGTEIESLVQAYAVEPTGKRLLAEATVSSESSKMPGIAATLPVGAAVSGVATAAAVSTGVGVVREVNTDVRNGAEDTAKAIVALMKPRLEKLGWIED